MGSYDKHFFGGKGGNRLIDSEKLIKVCLLLRILYRLNKYKETMKKICSTTQFGKIGIRFRLGQNFPGDREVFLLIF